MRDLLNYGNAPAYYWFGGGLISPGNVGAVQNLPGAFLSGFWPIYGTASNLRRRGVFIYSQEVYSLTRLTSDSQGSDLGNVIVGMWGKSKAVFPIFRATWQIYGAPANAG